MMAYPLLCRALFSDRGIFGSPEQKCNEIKYVYLATPKYFSFTSDNLRSWPEVSKSGQNRWVAWWVGWTLAIRCSGVQRWMWDLVRRPTWVCRSGCNGPMP